ncbi:hypothetical protein ACLB2K_007641 [Fragaria x ananassa]
MNGIRIKTWHKSPADSIASVIHFEDIIMNNVGNPILIDQEYRPWNLCNKQILCAKGLPCDKVKMTDINLKYNGKQGSLTSQCSNVRSTITRVPNPLACATKS